MNSPTIAPTASWLRLAEYGDWPHPRGLQRFTPAAAQSMVRYFKSLRGRMARKFGGLPVYIGHPDDAHFSGQSGHTDTRAYAWVTELDARTDGLYGAFKWSAAGEDLLSNAFYKFLSPRWAMEPLGADAFQPVRLLSIGLTNQPNIPGEAIANSTVIEKKTSAKEPTPTEETHANGANVPAMQADEYANATIIEDSEANAENVPTSDANAASISISQLREALGISSQIDPLEAITELREQSERFYRIACEQADKLAGETTSLANARSEQIALIVENAVLCGRIAPHETEQWSQAFSDNWEHTHDRLSTRTALLKTTAVANTRNSSDAPLTVADDFLARVKAHAQANNQNFAEAWSAIRRNHPDLYRQFFATGN